MSVSFRSPMSWKMLHTTKYLMILQTFQTTFYHFINLNWKCGRPPVYKDNITINKDGIPLCPKGFPMKQAAVEPKKRRIKYRCPKITCKGGTHNALAKILVLMLSMAEMSILV